MVAVDQNNLLPELSETELDPIQPPMTIRLKDSGILDKKL